MKVIKKTDYIYEWMKVGMLRFILFLMASTVCIAWCRMVPVQLLSERHQTEWNWVEYRLTLRNISSNAIFNPEIRYYAENSNIQYCKNNSENENCTSVNWGEIPMDTMLYATVDYSTWLYPVTAMVSSIGRHTLIKLKINAILYAKDSIHINFRIYKKDWGAWNSENDWSFQKNEHIVEPNYFFTVYDVGHNLLWGNDPLTGESNADVELWNDRNGNYAIMPYDGNSSEIQKAGRFWMIKDMPLNKKEAFLLRQAGVVKLLAAAKGEKSLILLKSNFDIRKKLIDSLVYGFYNSFGVDDSTALNIQYRSYDWTEWRQECDSLGQCRWVSVERSTVFAKTHCWDDVALENCRNIVESCGGENAAIDNYIIISENTKNSLACLQVNRDVQSIDIVHREFVDNNIGRKSVNIESLQQSNWNVDFSGFNDSVTSLWLANKKYTGENIVVGVYDTGIYYDHDGLNEWINGVKTPRNAFPEEKQLENGKYGTQAYHATHVAGIIGGNGKGSPGHKYRGIAPKVKFYSQGLYTRNQRGHVVNHSHTGKYEVNGTEKNTFLNWRNDSVDFRPKTFVASAGNFAEGYYDDAKAKVDSNMFGLGFHSIGFDTKNGIVVGNYASRTGIPNTTSSLGPTWDGRIKPDIMAPGSGLQVFYFQNSPFVAYLDYLKITHKNESTPYINLYFGENENILNTQAEFATTSIESLRDENATHGRALKWINAGFIPASNYINWPYQTFASTPFHVQQGDTFEVRMRLSEKTRQIYSNAIKGKIYLASADDFYSLPVSYIAQSYEKDISGVNDEYFEISFIWDHESIVSKFFRFDFDLMDIGIVSSVPCDEKNGGTCYDESSGTSMSAPYVSGIVALMNQAYMDKTGDETYSHSLRNSTSKAILIHTADDMVDEIGFGRSIAHDIFATTGQKMPVVYGKGPDFVTGWGKVNAEKALKMFDSYDSYKMEFRKFQEFEIEDAIEKRWVLNVNKHIERLRVTLTWDDAPGTQKKCFEKKLQNDLDLYLISPGGKYYFPWRLKPLSIETIDGKPLDENCSNGLEKISLSELSQTAFNDCGDGKSLNPICFDHLNNVEVIDVDLPERGMWIVAVRAKVQEGNSEDGFSQVASIVSDLPLENAEGQIGCELLHPYRPQSSLRCSYTLGNNLANYVTFSEQTYVGLGDYILLQDENENIIGKYRWNQLAGKRLKINSAKLYVTLESDNDSNVGYGFSISKIEKIPYSMLFGIH